MDVRTRKSPMNRIKKAFVVGIPWIGFVGFLIVFLSIVHGAYATFTTYGTFSGNLSGPSEIGIFFGGLLCLLCAPFLFFACIPVFKDLIYFVRYSLEQSCIPLTKNLFYLLRYSLCSSECGPGKHSHDHAHLLCSICDEREIV